MAFETSTPRSRRALLTAAVGSLGALIATAVDRPLGANAAAGDTLILGQANSAGTQQTTLTANVAGAAFTLKDPNAFGTGIFGWTSATTGPGRGVYGRTDSNEGTGVLGRATRIDGTGVRGELDGARGSAIHGVITQTGNIGTTYAVRGENRAANEIGVYGSALTHGSNTGGHFEVGTGGSAKGVVGIAPSGRGVVGEGHIGVSGVSEHSTGYGVWGVAPTTGYALYGSGDGAVTGSFSKASGSFKIDHPLAPATKYLQHSFVESPDMKNVYDGLVTLDAKGEATVKLPSYFEVLNRDVRYQLTPLGAFSPLYVKQRIAKGRFMIAGGSPGQEVCWQLTGIRQDPWAEAHRVVVEESKRGMERGTYLHPELHGQPESKGVDYEVRQMAGIGR